MECPAGSSIETARKNMWPLTGCPKTLVLYAGCHGNDFYQTIGRTDLVSSGFYQNLFNVSGPCDFNDRSSCTVAFLMHPGLFWSQCWFSGYISSLSPILKDLILSNEKWLQRCACLLEKNVCVSHLFLPAGFQWKCIVWCTIPLFCVLVIGHIHIFHVLVDILKVWRYNEYC